MALQYNDSKGPAAGEEINGGRGGEAKTFLPKSKMEKVPMCVMACVCVCAVYLCVCKQDPEVVLGQWGPVYSVPRVGVLGWLRPMVLHNQPAKSTSSTSDRLMNV